MKDCLKEEKAFKAIDENGRGYPFTMRADATVDEAKRYAALWMSLSGSGHRVVKVFES